MKKTEEISQFRGDRKYRIKKETLNSLLNDTDPKTTPRKDVKINSFERHLLQEGIKQVLFCEGREIIEYTDTEEPNKTGDWRHNTHTFSKVNKEMIQFLLDYDVIEEFFKD